MSFPADTGTRKTRGKSPLRALSPSRLLDALSSTPKAFARGSERSTTICRKLDFDEPTTPTSRSSSTFLRAHNELKSNLQKAFVAQYAIDSTTCVILQSIGAKIEQSDLQAHITILQHYVWANQENDPHALLEKALNHYTENIRALLERAPDKLRQPFQKLLKELASALFLHGHSYKGLMCLKDLLIFFGSDLDIECAYQKWCVLLNEWECLDNFYKEFFTRDRFVEHTKFAEICQLIRVFNCKPEKREESMYKLYDFLNEHKGEKTFANYELQALINSCLANAYKLSLNKDGMKAKDGMYHLEQMLHYSEVIVKNTAANLFPERHKHEYPALDLKNKDAGQILKTSSRIAEHFNYMHQYVLEMFKIGQTREACGNSLRAWVAAVRLGSHQIIVRMTSLLFWIRFASFYDSHSRDNMRTMLRLLYDDSPQPPKPYAEGDLKANDATLMGALSDTFNQLVINEDESSHPSIHLYDGDCQCVNCRICGVQPSYRVEWELINFAYSGFPVIDGCISQLHKIFDSCRAEMAVDQKLLLGTFAKPRPPVLMSILWATVMVQWLRHNDGYQHPRASDEDIEEVVAYTEKIAKYAQTTLYVDLLALRQATRPRPPPLAFDWLEAEESNRTGILTRCFTPRVRAAPKMSSKDKEAVLQKARQDFRAFSHLMHRDWRLPVCSLIARLSTNPWETAMMAAEMGLLATRQAARTLEQDVGEIFIDVARFEAAVKNVPEDMTLFQLLLNDSGDLIVVKMHRDRKPIIVPLALKKKVDKFLEEMAVILKENDSTGNLAKLTTDSKFFWKERRRVDELLMKFCDKMQDEIIGRFAMLFRPSASLGRHGQNAAKCIQSMTEMKLGDETRAGLPSHMAAELVSLFATSYERGDAGEEFDAQWRPLLKTMLALVNLPATTASTISRSNDDFYPKLVAAKKDTAQDHPRYTMLVISPELSVLPWESMPIFNDAYVGRVGSVHQFLRIFGNKAISVPCSIDPTRGAYICDPDNNLTETKKRMGDHMAKFGWKGTIGQVPGLDDFKQMLSGNDIYVYIGHGSGSKYFGRTLVRKSGCTAVSLLMGCSSVAITPEGRGLDGRSAIFDYIIGSCPCLVGCLWMVTDGEIDRYLIDLSNYMFDAKEKKGMTKKGQGLRMLMDGMAFARSRCKLRYLTGASVVSYGLPVVTMPEECLSK
ncbi:unnamed protein product, partial [Mesorhabditis spiculigera]